MLTANQNPQMNPSPAIGNNKSSINIADDVLWVEGSTETMYYVHKDDASATLSTGLGSISAITDATGNLVESLSDGLLDRKRNQMYNVFIPDDREAPAGTSQQFFETTGFPMPWR